MRTTIIYAPHPDDEVLYLGSYIAYCASRGDKLLLVAVTDGGSSGAKPSTWTVEDLKQVRVNEQTAAWEALCGTANNRIHRMQITDGSISADRIKVIAQSLEKTYKAFGTVEHYACANTSTATVANQASDHLAVANGLKSAGVPVARGSKVPRDTSSGGTVYLPSLKALNQCQQAADCYAPFGKISVPTDWNALENSGYKSRIVGL